MYFDLEEGHPDIYGIGSAMSWREGILLAFVLHLLAILTFVLMPPVDRTKIEALTLDQQQAQARQRENEARRFVFVQPRLDTPATRPPAPQADDSDRDRNARTVERAPDPRNMMPFSRGNTPERVEVNPTPVQPEPPQQDNSADQRNGSPPPGPGASAETDTLAAIRKALEPGPRPQESGGGTGRGGLSDAIRNVQRYVPSEMFDNPQGGTSMFGPAIQFDTKGVEFGPWIRRFIAQIKRNWDIPYAAMSMRGHVVVTFNVHKDGRISDLTVVGPCAVGGFNNSSYNALAASSPTYPLPPEYPSDKAFFTVTFYYNENPPG